MQEAGPGLGRAYLSESVQEGFWQSLPAAALLKRILARKDTEALWTVERRSKLRDVDGCTMVEARVQAFKDGLRREIELIKDHPMACFQRGEERAILPRVRTRRRPFDRQVGTKEFHEVRLLGEVDAYDMMAARCAKSLN